jgi:energy-coupling factor transporter ATP-binding protein EcfA2
MINKVLFQNFKAIQEASVSLERFTVFVGPNGSGKTSILEGIDCLCAAWEGELQRVFKGPDEIQRFRCANSHEAWALAGWGDDFYIDFYPGGDRSRYMTPRSVEIAPVEPMAVDLDDGVADFVVRKTGRYGPGRSMALRLDPASIAAPSYGDGNDSSATLRRDGERLASVLAHLETDRPAEYARILDELRFVIPFVRHLLVTKNKKTLPVLEVSTEVDGKPAKKWLRSEFSGHALSLDTGLRQRIPASMASEGTLIVLGLLTAIVGSEPPQVLLVDDLDRGLHPKAQKDLIEVLRRHLDQNPQMQIIATSHSPYLLDCLEPQEVRLTTLRDDGTVVCGRLDEHPNFEKWKEAMTPGEFWSMVGENWLLENVSGDRGQ